MKTMQMKTTLITSSNNKNKILLLSVMILTTMNNPYVCLSDPRISEAGLFCGGGRAAAGTDFIQTFVREMESLSNGINTTGHFSTHSYSVNAVGTAVNASAKMTMYGLAQCYGDLSRTECLLCHAASRTRLPRCLPATSARIFLDGCFLRYDNYSFYSEPTDPVNDSVNCSSSAAVDYGGGLAAAVEGTVRILAGKSGAGFGVAEFKGVFGLAQCWESVGERGCTECLAKASSEVLKRCRGSQDGRSLNAGCYLRYSTVKFFNDRHNSQRSHHLSQRRKVIVAIGLGIFAFLMISLFGAYVFYARLKKSRAVRKNLGQASMSINKSSLNFKYEVLERATDYFSVAKKIGQGGAGSVYKGNLSNGQTVAVKRLIYNTRQWVDEFFNEVNLINGIHHKNLVKLLGCSIEGPESLLVYEYVPNRSLDHFLFEKNKVQILNWEQRFHIIVGTAEGLEYLHGGSKLRLIHRDIKSSNVLLDENLTPKIADFGLVRCFGPDKTHLSTGIAGTLGYMAPEYLVRGQVSDKSDVYSFGVLALEIVCGRRNCAFTQDSGSLLQTVWTLYKSEKLCEAVDPCLKGDFPANEVSNVLKIGLLCTQASVSLRPSMCEVVSMLTNEDEEIPTPNQPPFLNASVLDPTSSTRSYSSQSLMSNKALTKTGGSYTSTEISSSNSSDGPSRA